MDSQGGILNNYLPDYGDICEIIVLKQGLVMRDLFEASLLTDCQNVLLRKSQNNFRLIQILPIFTKFCHVSHWEICEVPTIAGKKCPLYRI